MDSMGGNPLVGYVYPLVVEEDRQMVNESNRMVMEHSDLQASEMNSIKVKLPMVIEEEDRMHLEEGASYSHVDHQVA